MKKKRGRLENSRLGRRRIDYKSLICPKCQKNQSQLKKKPHLLKKARKVQPRKKIKSLQLKGRIKREMEKLRKEKRKKSQSYLPSWSMNRTR